MKQLRLISNVVRERRARVYLSRVIVGGNWWLCVLRSDVTNTVMMNLSAGCACTICDSWVPPSINHWVWGSWRYPNISSSPVWLPLTLLKDQRQTCSAYLTKTKTNWKPFSPRQNTPRNPTSGMLYKYSNVLRMNSSFPLCSWCVGTVSSVSRDFTRRILLVQFLHLQHMLQPGTRWLTQQIHVKMCVCVALVVLTSSCGRGGKPSTMQ